MHSRTLVTVDITEVKTDIETDREIQNTISDLETALCHPSKNGHRKASKNGMNRSLSFVFEIRPHLFHGSLDNEPLPT